jgi:hypothetical protein
VSTATADLVDQARRTVTLRETLADVEAFIIRYMVLTVEQSVMATLWIAQTYVIDAFDHVAYLNIKSPMPECGKTRLLEVLEALVNKPWLTGRVTAAVLMRKVHKERPVLLLDESDAAFSGEKEYAEALRGLLNTGFQQNGKASACVGQGAGLTYQDFSTFGAKAIAGIGALPSTIESRSIPIALKRKTKSELVDKWRRRDAWEEADGLRQRLEAVLKVDDLRGARPTMPEGLSDRAEDVLEPLFAIADSAGGTFPSRARTAAVALMGHQARGAQEADQAIRLELLADIRTIFEEEGNPDVMPTQGKADAVPPTTGLLDALNNLDDRPWGTWSRGKPLTGHALRRLLKDFDVHPGGTMREGKRTFRGYRLATFEDAFVRYLPSEVSQRNNTNKTGPEVADLEVKQGALVPLSECQEPRCKDSVCNAVTLPARLHEDEDHERF